MSYCQKCLRTHHIILTPNVSPIAKNQRVKISNLELDFLDNIVFAFKSYRSNIFGFLTFSCQGVKHVTSKWKRNPINSY